MMVKSRDGLNLVVAVAVLLLAGTTFCEALSSLTSSSSSSFAPSSSSCLLFSVIRRQRESSTALSYKSQDDDDDDAIHNNGDEHRREGPDWRDFRAKLVMQYQRSTAEQGDNEGSSPSSLVLPNETEADKTYQEQSWAYESQDVIEKGSLIVSSPHQDFACGGLRQQYFHKCVVLVVEHTPRFTKGIVLNRPVQHTLSTTDPVWHFAGDVQGFSWSHPPPSTICLHSNTDWSEYSESIVNDIQNLPWESAWDLIDLGKASFDDFWIGTGYAGWKAGQLQEELDRGNWHMVTTDKHTISSLLRADNDRDADSSGIDMWAYLLGKIGRSDLVQQGSMLEFEDTMLKEWMKELSTTVTDPIRIASSALNLPVPPSLSSPLDNIRGDSRGKKVPSAQRSAPLPGFEPGTIIRSTKPFLLNNQVLHQALVLIVQNDHTCCAGVVLNRPSSNMVDNYPGLSIRYGGRYGIEDPENGNKTNGKQKPEFWLFNGRHVALNAAQVGTPVGKNKVEGLWNCTRQDVETAVAMGLAQPSDFLNIIGLTVWVKPPFLSDNVPDSIEELHEAFEVVSSQRIPLLWDILTQQVPLSKDTLANNLKAANFAWKIAADPSTKKASLSMHNRPVDEPSSSVQQHRLANLALERWIRMFLAKLEPKRRS